MAEFMHDPSINEIKAHAEKKRAEALQKKSALENHKKKIKTAAALTTLGAVTAAAVTMGVKAKAQERPQLPDNRFSPENTMPSAVDESQLTPEQLAEKKQIDDAEAAAEKSRAEQSAAPVGIPQTVRDQNSEGLDTTNIE